MQENPEATAAMQQETELSAAEKAQQAEDKKRLGLLKVLWPASELGGGFNKAYFSTYNTYLYTDVYRMSTMFSGVLSLVQTIVGWIGGPLIGTFIDRFSFKKAKYYPWIIGGTIVAYLAWILLFSLPALGLAGAGMGTVALVLAIVIAVATPFSSVPISAVFPQMSSDPKDRQYFAMMQKIGRDGGKTVFGYLVPWLLVLFTAKMGESNAYAVLGLIIGLITIAFYVALAFGLRGSYVERNAVERSHTADGTKRKNISLGKMLQAVFTNKSLLSMYCFMSVHKGYYFIYVTCAAYAFKYLFGDFGMVGTFMTVFNLCAIIGVAFGPLWRKIFKETKRCFFMCMLTHVVLQLVIALSFKSLSVPAYLGLFGASSFFMGMLENYIMPMFAASADYGAWKAGNRLDGISMSIYSLTITTGVLLATIIRTAVLNKIGLDAVVAGGAITAAFSNGLTNLFTWIPFAMSVISLGFIALFPLNDKRIAIMNEDIKAGRTASESASKF